MYLQLFPLLKYIIIFKKDMVKVARIEPTILQSWA